MQVGLEAVCQQGFAEHRRFFEGENDEVFVLYAAFVEAFDGIAAIALHQQKTQVAHEAKIAFHRTLAQVEIQRELVFGASQRRTQSGYHLQKAENLAAVVHNRGL